MWRTAGVCQRKTVAAKRPTGIRAAERRTADVLGDGDDFAAVQCQQADLCVSFLVVLKKDAVTIPAETWAVNGEVEVLR
jgi:hypothetical protein